MLKDNHYLIPSVYNRLLDENPEKTQEVLSGQSLKEYKEAVLNDLVDLFNSRHPPLNEVNLKSEIARSIHYYGLPDFTNLNPDRTGDLQIIAKAMERAIRLFEPRLNGTKVTLLDISKDFKNMEFKIESTLIVDPEPLPIQVGTILDTSSQIFDPKK